MMCEQGPVNVGFMSRSTIVLIGTLSVKAKICLELKCRMLTPLVCLHYGSYLHHISYSHYKPYSHISLPLLICQVSVLPLSMQAVGNNV